MGTVPRAQVEARRRARAERNVQIWHRHKRGETQRQIAKDFGISQKRVSEIYHAVDERLTRALMSRSREPYYEPYAYDIWFHFEAGKPGANVEP